MTALGPAGEAVARAYPNIALVKYWGKRDENLILPVAGSISITLDRFATVTRVRPVPGLTADQFHLNGSTMTGEPAMRVSRFLDLVRYSCGRTDCAQVESVNGGPTAAGLASSASGFAALTVAAAAAYGLDATARTLSRLARRGSGSACRSIFGGFVEWHAGGGMGTAGDIASFAEPIPAALDIAVVIAVADSNRKAVSSRRAMRHTAATSPYFTAWRDTATADLAPLRTAVRLGDLDRAGEIAEANMLAMHAAILAARPAIRYLSPVSLLVLDRIRELREQGTSVYATADAGPNVAALCAPDDAGAVAAALEMVPGVRTVHTSGVGPGATALDPHFIDLPDERGTR